MTQAQEDIKRYIATQFVDGYYQLRPLEDNIVELRDYKGETMRFSINQFGDILDADDNNKIIAKSDLPHDKRKRKPARPRSWKNQPSYFC